MEAMTGIQEPGADGDGAGDDDGDDEQRTPLFDEEWRAWIESHPEATLAVDAGGDAEWFGEIVVESAPTGIEVETGAITLCLYDAVATTQRIATLEISHEEALALAHTLLSTVDAERDDPAETVAAAETTDGPTTATLAELIAEKKEKAAERRNPSAGGR